MKKRTHEEFVEELLIKNKYYANGEIELIGRYVDSKTNIACRCVIDGNRWNPRASHLLEGQGCSMCKHKRVGVDDFLARLKATGKEITALDLYIDMKTKIRFQCKLGHIWPDTPDNILRGCGCPYCSGHKVLIGFNDLWTIRPDVAQMLKNLDDGYKYTKGSAKKLSFICPDCQKEKIKSIADVCRQGLCCDYCGDGVSYPEKFGRAFLNQLPIKNHKCEYRPDWAKPYFYDDYFLYNNFEYIIEWDGAFHYLERNGIETSLEERQAIDELKDDLAINHNINIFRIDCLLSDPNYIKQHILDSELSNIFDLSNIDWDLCNLSAQNNLVREACNLYSSGEKSLKAIGYKLHISEDIVRSYLKRGTAIGWCDYDPFLSRQEMYDKKSKNIVWLDDNNNVVCNFRSARMCVKEMQEKYNIVVTRSGVKWSCKTHKPYKGFNFRFANETIQN